MQTLELSAADAVSIASLINSANSGSDAKITPALHQVRLRIKDGTVTAFATDRFTLASYTATAAAVSCTCTECAAGEPLPELELGLTAGAAKFITANVKRGSKWNTPENVEITWDTETREFSIRHGAAVYGDTFAAGKFPAVESLLNEWQADTTPRPVVLRGEFLARLNKFIDAFTKVEYWTMELGANPNGNYGRPGPVMARRGGFKVLIQPNLMQQD